MVLGHLLPDLRASATIERRRRRRKLEPTQAAPVPDRAGGRARLRERPRRPARLGRVPARRPRALPDHGRADHLQRQGRARARRTRSGDEYDPERFEFVNHTLKKKGVNEMVSDLVEAYGAPAVAQVLDAFKDLGFHYASQAGITISKNDIVSPPNKEEILDRYEKQAQEIQGQYEEGYITAEERKEAVTERWDKATEEVAAGDGGQPPRAEPDLHDGQLGRPRIVQADPPAGRHARPDGQPEGRDHRAADQGQLHGGPVGARVLHLHPRRPQGPRRHRAADGRLRLPHPAPGRRRPGRDRPRRGLQDQGVHRDAAPRRRRRAERRT